MKKLLRFPSKLLDYLEEEDLGSIFALFMIIVGSIFPAAVATVEKFSLIAWDVATSGSYIELFITNWAACMAFVVSFTVATVSLVFLIVIVLKAWKSYD